MRYFGNTSNAKRSKYSQLERSVRDQRFHKWKLQNTFTALTFCCGLSAVSALMPITEVSANTQQPSFAEFAKMDFKQAKDYCQSKADGNPHNFTEICDYIRDNDQLIIKRGLENAEKFKAQIEDKDLLFNEKIVGYMIELVEADPIHFDMSQPSFPNVENQSSNFCSSDKTFDMAYLLSRYIAYYTVYLRLLSHHQSTGGFDFQGTFNPTYIQNVFYENEGNPLTSLSPQDFYKILQKPELLSKLRKLAIDKNIAIEIKTIIPILKEYYSHYLATKERLLRNNNLDDFLIDIERNKNFQNMQSELGEYAITKPSPCYGETSISFRFNEEINRYAINNSYIYRIDTDWYFFSFWLRRDMEGSTRSTLNIIEAAQSILDSK